MSNRSGFPGVKFFYVCKGALITAITEDKFATEEIKAARSILVEQPKISLSNAMR